MIDRLRKRFIRITMGSVLVVLTVLMAGINLSNLVNADQSASQRLEILAANGGSFPKSFQEKTELSRPDAPELATGTTPDSKVNDSSGKGETVWQNGPRGLSPETPYETRYFSVELSKDGSLSNVNTGKIAAISSDEAVSMTEKLAAEGKTSGYSGNYKFLAQSTSAGGTRYIFLDCTRDLMSVKSFFRNSLLISLLGMAAVLLLVVALSKRAIRPMVESYEKQKQFITNAGHEIKTPLTIIDSCTEVLEMEQGENKWTEGIRSQVKRLTALTASLVSLTRMDESGSELPMGEFDLSAAVRDALEPFALLAESNRLKLEEQVQEGIRYCGNETALRQLCSILADNAVKYALPKSTIVMTLMKKGRKIFLSCKNEAQGLQKGNLDVLFDRFYRGDTSRASEKSGYGIGLSMARSIVTAHGGQIKAGSEDGKTLTIAVQL